MLRLKLAEPQQVLKNKSLERLLLISASAFKTKPEALVST